MSGHSKWATIKRAKGANDAKRGAIFTKLANIISISVKEGGGGDPNSNFKLRLAMEKARAVNMTKDAIARAIDRGLGKTGGADLSEAVFEGFAPGGVAIMIQTITDNKNRTAGFLRTVIEKGGGVMGNMGSVGYLFTHCGEIELDPNKYSPEETLEKAVEAGADDVEENFIYTPASKLHEVKEKLAGMPIISADLVYRPNKETMVAVSDVNKLADFLSAIEDLDDVQNVFTNAEFGS